MDYFQLCQDTIRAIERVAKFIQSESQNFSRDFVGFKGRNDLVTYVDKESEKKLIESLAPLVPEAGFMAEEDHQQFNEEKSTNWIIDPLDGTLNFVHQIPFYCISVAFMEEGETKVGVVYELNNDDCFYSYEGGNAYLNGEPIRVSENTHFEYALFATGFPFTDRSNVAFFTRILDDLLAQTRGVRRIGSAALDLCYTAAGRFDCYYEYNLKAWDVAAGALILKNAGGEVFDFKGGGNYLFGGEIIGGNPSISQTFLALFQNKYKNN